STARRSSSRSARGQAWRSSSRARVARARAASPASSCRRPRRASRPGRSTASSGSARRTPPSSSSTACASRTRRGEVGAGFKVAMSALDNGRISLAAGSVGIAAGCVDACLAYVGERKQFGRSIGAFQLVQELIADTAVETEAARLMAWRAAYLADAGQPYTLAASQAKYYASEVAVRAANAAVQVHGGYGYVDE